MCRSTSVSPDEVQYYRERAEVEWQCASQSSNPHAREIHEKLAELYERLVELDEPARHGLRMVRNSATA